MNLFRNYFSLLVLALICFSSCKKDGEAIDDIKEEMDMCTIYVDIHQEFQEIDGFGFFGAHDVWWANSQNLWNEEWGIKIINDLGITIWRNEYFPPAISGANQDADWNKQKPVVEGLKRRADEAGVDLKFIFSVWSPPADLKWKCSFAWAGDENAIREPGNVSTKNGGTLNPEKYKEFAEWIIDGIQMYKDLGIDLYALSLQNEPLFSQPFNSCTYTTQWYCEMLNAVVPKVKEAFPDVLIFGSENMLEMEGKENNWRWLYHNAIKNNAADNVDILAVHGYSDGVAPTSGSELVQMWVNHTEQFAKPLAKPVWMSETSGYSNNWEKRNSTPGALNLAMDIHTALCYGNVSAWVWWQGSQSVRDNFSLMSGLNTSKKYFVSKHFYRFIRPGAVRVSAESDQEEVLVSAWSHKANGTQTIVVINSSASSKVIRLVGIYYSDQFKVFRTSEGIENCVYVSDYDANGNGVVSLPRYSILTLQTGGEPL
ncbi:glycoside hydrolase [Alkaliflexus imshenetskii]|uniref:glycoside hydrolase family 30 beta sandwich domain-containing protein n=1 Tax=Alkaliflexus imshenetskii TaxID=286730 RepID=UPI000478E430|nr:glycoside hydrolase family 30 beta sandwich domain-containing protein [Alkaliflexus imshenetskii]